MTEATKAAEVLLLPSQLPKRGVKVPKAGSEEFRDVLKLHDNSGDATQRDAENAYSVEAKFSSLLGSLATRALEQRDPEAGDDLASAIEGVHRDPAEIDEPLEGVSPELVVPEIPREEEVGKGVQPDEEDRQDDPSTPAIAHPVLATSHGQQTHILAVSRGERAGTPDLRNDGKSGRHRMALGENLSSWPADTPVATEKLAQKVGNSVRTDWKEGSKNPQTMPLRSHERVLKEPAESNFRLVPSPVMREVTTSSEGVSATSALSPTGSALLSELSRAPALPVSRAESAALFPQLGQKILNGVKIQLHPAELGTVSVRMAMAGAQLTVEIQSETFEAYKRLSSDAEGIVRALRGLGFEVDRIVIQQPQGGAEPKGNPENFQQAGHENPSGEKGMPNQSDKERAKELTTGHSAEETGNDRAATGDLYI